MKYILLYYLDSLGIELDDIHNIINIETQFLHMDNGSVSVVLLIIYESKDEYYITTQEEEAVDLVTLLEFVNGKWDMITERGLTLRDRVDELETEIKRLNAKITQLMTPNNN